MFTRLPGAIVMTAVAAICAFTPVAYAQDTGGGTTPVTTRTEEDNGFDWGLLGLLGLLGLAGLKPRQDHTLHTRGDATVRH